MQKIGWIGTGKMGGRMAKRLLERGYPLAVCDVVRENKAELLQLGAEDCPSPAVLAESADVLISIIPNQFVLEEIVCGENGILRTMRAGQIFADMSTVDPQTSSRVAKAVEEAGGVFLRAPVSGSTAYAASGDLKVMVSGRREAYDEMLPIFEILANRQFYLGKGEEARHAKIAVNMMLSCTMQMMAESLVYAQKTGLDWEAILDVIGESAAASPVVKFKLEAYKKRDFTPMSTIDTSVKDANLALQTAKDMGFCLPMTALANHLATAVQAKGMGHLDYSAVLLLAEEMNGIRREYRVDEP